MSRLKLNTIWVIKVSEFYNRSIQSCLKDNGAEMYSRYEDRKYVVSEKFMRNIKNRIYIIQLTNTAIISNKNQNENYLSKVVHIDFDVINNDKDPKFKHEYYVMTLIIKALFQIFQIYPLFQIGLKNFF